MNVFSFKYKTTLHGVKTINPLVPNVPFLYLLKKPQKTLRLSDVFKKKRKGAVATNRLTLTLVPVSITMGFTSLTNEDITIFNENIIFGAWTSNYKGSDKNKAKKKVIKTKSMQNVTSGCLKVRLKCSSGRKIIN